MTYVVADKGRILPALRKPASELEPGDVMPLVTFGYGAVVASVEPTGAAMLRVTFREPVQSRWMPERTTAALTFYPTDLVCVRR